MKKPYRLFKRRPQNIWYYRLPDKPTGHSTGQKSRAKAEEYVISILNGSSQQPQHQTTLGAFAADFFVKGKCDWIDRKERKGKIITKEMAQMRRGHLNNHILPKFKNRLMSSITHAEVDSWLSSLQLSNRMCTPVISDSNSAGKRTAA